MPPLHRLEQQQQSDPADLLMDGNHNDPTATEFLSRLLLLLGSFVIFCLLLF